MSMVEIVVWREPTWATTDLVGYEVEATDGKVGKVDEKTIQVQNQDPRQEGSAPRRDHPIGRPRRAEDLRRPGEGRDQERSGVRRDHVPPDAVPGRDRQLLRPVPGNPVTTRRKAGGLAPPAFAFRSIRHDPFTTT
jgi:hypothetical protein